MYKSKLQELCQRKKWALPSYTSIKDGPDHIPQFQASVIVNGLSFDSPVSCKSYKDAHNHAAMLAFLHFTSPSGSFAEKKNFEVKNTQPTESKRPVEFSRRSQGGSQPSSLRRTLGSDSQNLLEYFKKMQADNPGFFYAVQLDEGNQMSNVFWADSRSRTAYSHFGDVVTLDTTCRVNQYKVPFAPFTGVNHHGQTILFGCALLLDESEASFIWLFKTFLTAMNDQTPVSIVTDQDRVIQTAVAQVFPEARHCISKWHALREGREKLAHICLAYPNFQVELFNCINLTETIEEFESSWNSILDKYDLRRNGWLQSLYNARAEWVPVYFRDSFLAAISPNICSDSPFFDGYVNQQTTLPMFFRQYERALENLSKKEIEADFDTICTMPALRTSSPIEKQAANLYTRNFFTKFQEELVESFEYTANRTQGDGAVSTFKVAKFKDDKKAFIVTLNNPKMRANCSCKMFEYSGILCRHVLNVLTVINVVALPSHYILKRWTRNAKSGPGAEERSGDLHGQESLTLRYNNLCWEATRYAEEGATAVETYHAALSALKDGEKKIALVKKNIAKAAPPSSQVRGTSYENRKISASASDAMPLRQDEVFRRSNFNDAGAPAQSVPDLNSPRMATVSLHRDDGPPENMVVLPVLKSMSWVMKNKNSTSWNKVAFINLKLQDFSRTPSAESEFKFHLSKVLLKQMFRSMIEQLSTPANKVAVINLKLQETTPEASEVEFQVSRETLGTMLTSMANSRQHLSNAVSNSLNKYLFWYIFKF
ncbi:protein FAR1-RELATED SEQUENCE 3-like isoform X1 [Ziziphus jujuba]|uniref:Protein FAR1-RELATED SEQUENCE n=1 Tax=Ziziphus jujuba TaxID=326968 RepID=A0A6P6FYC2_ZIZJJ|nr:protein FAR1-RELATED SEQUENCE 3-like isoform X1 [Ziziphus jujuba]